MALNKLKYNSLNITPAANKAIGFDSDADALEATLEGGAMTFIKKITASSDSTISFVDGSSDVVLDNTYKEYMFIFKNIHPASDGAAFRFQVSINSGSAYGVAITSTNIRHYHNEGGSDNALSLSTNFDLANSTNFQALSDNVGSDTDHSCNGILHVFNPSSTTFVKHFKSNFVSSHSSDYSYNNLVAGYVNTTSAVDAIRFDFNDDNAVNIDSGTITLYGIN